MQFMRSSQLYKIIVKSLCFFISIYGWGILSFSEKLWTTHQIRHNEESLTLMTPSVYTGGVFRRPLKGRKVFFFLFLLCKREQKVKMQTFHLGQQDKMTKQETKKIHRRNKKWHKEASGKRGACAPHCLPAMAMESFWPGEALGEML